MAQCCGCLCSSIWRSCAPAFLKALYGFLAILALCVAASDRLFEIVMAPGYDAMNRTAISGAGFIAVGVMEKFQIIWVKTPLVASIFLASPWILWQAWAFVSPGLYPREKRWAIPFVLAIASLFLLGGCFGYFVAFRYGMTFLLGIGKDTHVLPLISIADYFDRLVDILLGIGVAFELPVVMVFLTLIRVASPSSAAAFRLRDFGHRDSCGSRHTDARHVQPGSVRRADVRTVLSRGAVELYRGTEAEPAMAVQATGFLKNHSQKY